MSNLSQKSKYNNDNTLVYKIMNTNILYKSRIAKGLLYYDPDLKIKDFFRFIVLDQITVF